MTRKRFLASFVAGVLCFSAVQADGKADTQPTASLEQLWDDAVYYFRVARMDMGQAHLQAFLDREPKPLEVLALSDKDARAAKIFIKLQSDKKLGTLASSVLDLIDKGWQQRRKDPARIAGELERLGGSQRAQFHAMARLKDSGEYAVPVMVEFLSDANRAALHGRIIDALVELGKGSTEGLVVALQHANDKAKLLIIEALAQLDYAQVLPYLKELADTAKDGSPVRLAAAKAIETIAQRNPKYRTDAGAGRMFYTLATRYYYRDSAVLPAVPSASLVADVRAYMPNIWVWRDGRLVDQPVPWEIYYELMANCKRQLCLSDKVSDPLHGEDFPTAGYFFRTAGTGYCLAALDRAMTDNDVAVALASLSAMTDVAAGADILRAIGDSQPIVRALDFPNQLVHLWSALALGWSAPQQAYPGADRVVPLLGKTLLGPEKPVACMVVVDKDKSRQLTASLEGLGYQVAAFVDFESCLEALKKSVQARTEVFVIDYDLPTPGAGQAVAQLGNTAMLKLVPTIIIATTARAHQAEVVFKGVKRVTVLPGMPDKTILAAKLAYLQRQLGRRVATGQETRRMALLAGKGLERLATMNLKNYDVGRATVHLARAAAKDDWALAYQCGRALAHLGGADAQQGLANAALGKADADQKIKMFDLLGVSARRWGNRLQADTVGRLQKVVITETNHSLRDAAAAVLGSLNLESSEARKVLLIKDEFGKIGGQ